jgi:hypothetical protein
MNYMIIKVYRVLICASILLIAMRANSEGVLDITSIPNTVLPCYGSLKMNIRVTPICSEHLFICTAMNKGEEPIDIQYAKVFLANRNNIIASIYDDVERRHWVLGVLEDLLYPSPPLTIAGNSQESHLVPQSFLDAEGSFLIGHYAIMSWMLDKQMSPSIHVGFVSRDSKNKIASPVVDPSDPTAKPILAFIFNENQTNELGFLFLNGSNEAVTVEKPLTQASRIVATSPAIEYTKELFIAGQPSENIAIEAGKVGEWRIPWQTIRDLIPEADLAAIKEGGGDLDLVWKVGDFQSDPLPLSLSDPPGDSN